MRSDATRHRWCESAAFSALALDFGINLEWQKREAWLLLGGRWDRKKPV